MARRGSQPSSSDWNSNDVPKNLEPCASVWHRGLADSMRQATAAVFVCQLLLRYKGGRGANNGTIKWILDALQLPDSLSELPVSPFSYPL